VGVWWCGSGRYLAFCLLTADVQLDFRSLMRFLGFVQKLSFLEYDAASAEYHPDKYIENLRQFYNNAEVGGGGGAGGRGGADSEGSTRSLMRMLCAGEIGFEMPEECAASGPIGI
jgi:hypothetical protein